MSDMPLSKPPEGATVGESVPRENEAGDWEEINRMMSQLKSRGQPWVSMNDSELRKRARKKLETVQQ